MLRDELLQIGGEGAVVFTVINMSLYLQKLVFANLRDRNMSLFQSVFL